MTERNSGTQKAGDLELVIDRVFDAPRDLVWKAWTAQMDQWSAPKGYTMPVSEGDLRPGGKWRSCMRTPDGKDLWLGGVYREIVEPEKLVFTHAWDDPTGHSGPETLVTVMLAERDGKTEMNFRQTGFTSVDSRNAHAHGWNQCFELLDALLGHS